MVRQLATGNPPRLRDTSRVWGFIERGDAMQAIPITHQPETPAAGAMASLSGYPAAVLCWLLSAGVYIAAKWVAPEMPPWGLCFWRLALACIILLPIVHRHHGAMRPSG